MLDGSSESCHGSETAADDASVWSGETEADEGLELSQQLLEGSLATGAALENQDQYLNTISTRLQAAVEKLLLAISETSNQVRNTGPGVVCWSQGQSQGQVFELGSL